MITRRDFLVGILTGLLTKGIEPVTKHRIFMPLLTKSYRPVKAGVAFSSHAMFAERVALLKGTVGFWRGWAVFGSAPQDMFGLQATACLTRDFYYRPTTSRPLDEQLRLLDYLGREYSGHLLFLNEPNESDFEIKQAVKLYVHTRKVCPNASLVGPGISHTEYLNGFPWLREWLDAVRSETGRLPEMSIWDIHNYLQQGDPLAPINALREVLSEYGISSPKFFISEWGASTPERTTEMMVAFRDESSVLRHYFYDQYMAFWDGDDRPIQLFEETHSPLRLSDIGRAFVNAATP